MIEYSKQLNEEVFHVFGYTKDDREENTTPFMDYEGKARPESVAKTDYYKELNKFNWEKRMKVKHGELPEEKVIHSYNDPKAVNLIHAMDVFSNSGVLPHLSFDIAD